MKRLLLVLPCALLAACGGAEDADDATGTLQIEAHLDPATPQVGQHELQLQIRDRDGAGVEGATITVDPFMPHHGHGSTEDAVVTELGDGAYVATPLTFTMPGLWEVTIHAAAGGEEGRVILDWNVQ